MNTHFRMFGWERRFISCISLSICLLVFLLLFIFNTIISSVTLCFTCWRKMSQIVEMWTDTYTWCTLMIPIQYILFENLSLFTTVSLSHKFRFKWTFYLTSGQASETTFTTSTQNQPGDHIFKFSEHNIMDLGNEAHCSPTDMHAYTCTHIIYYTKVTY